MRAKHIIGDFEGFFEGAKTFYTKSALSPAKSNFGVKKFEAHGSQKSHGTSKNLEKLPIMCFASIQKITSETIRISDALVFLSTGATICLILFRFYLSFISFYDLSFVSLLIPFFLFISSYSWALLASYSAMLRHKVTITTLFVLLCCNRNLRQKGVSIISYFYCAVKFSKEKNQKVLIMEPKTISQLCRI
jgi:hypothetical protein